MQFLDIVTSGLPMGGQNNRITDRGWKPSEVCVVCMLHELGIR
jgi:hypothetical protein